MDPGETEWAGVRFLAIHPRDLSMMRGPGLYGLVRRGPTAPCLLFIGQGENIREAAAAAPGIRAAALGLGMDEACVCLTARDRVDRLILTAHVLKHLRPPLNSGLSTLELAVSENRRRRRGPAG